MIPATRIPLLSAVLSLFFALIPAAVACNGNSKLCDRRYDQIIFPTTHNSTAVRSGPNRVLVIPNQGRGVAAQLKDGIRAMMIDLWSYNGPNLAKKHQIYTCHRFCGLGGMPAIKSLKQIKSFLDLNPTEVITLILENHASESAVAREFRRAGLQDQIWIQPVGAPWPTLRQMIDQKKRLVVFTEVKRGAVDWMLPLFDHAVETHYSVKYRKDLSCDLNRGSRGARLFILNHFLTRTVNRRKANRPLNRMDRLLTRGIQCENEVGQAPNFLAVDFYETGQVVQATELLNHLRL